MHLRNVFFTLLLATTLASAQTVIQTRPSPRYLQPTGLPTGGSGLINLQSATTNPMGSLSISLQGLFVQRDLGSLGKDNLGTGMLSLTYALTRDLEAYFSGSYIAGMTSQEPDFTLTDPRLGLGSQDVGIKVRLPLKRANLFQAAGSAGFVLGTAKNKVAGFNYLNSRRGSDVKFRLMQTLRLQDLHGLPNLHVNEGYITEGGPAPDLLLLGVGTDYLLNDHWQFMAEFQGMIEQRTPIYLNENYLALTGAVRYFAGPGLSFNAGANFGLSQSRVTDTSWRRGDPWQIFLGFTLTPNVTKADLDQDGIPDWLDAENTLPMGVPRDQFGNLLDSDGDSVPDYRDREPNPHGAIVDENGIAKDSDRDGVSDGLDRQPNTPFGALVDEAGMAVDSDADGVADGLDLEPNTPPGALVDASGRSLTPQNAPPANLASLGVIEKLEASLMKLPNLHFDTGSARIKPEDYSTLEVVGQTLVQYPMLVVLIEGHADSTGSQKRNEELSYQRARAVREYLLSQFPQLTRANFTVTGLGQKDPLADDGTPDGRTQNRRVEFKILNRDVLQQMITTWE